MTLQVVNVGQAKAQLSDLLNRVAYRGERIVLAKRGREVGALVSREDLRLLQEIEDQRDLELFRHMRKTSKKKIPFDEFVREYEQTWGVKLGVGKE
jgi:prevent-host-death family protein